MNKQNQNIIFDHSNVVINEKNKEKQKYQKERKELGNYRRTVRLEMKNPAMTVWNAWRALAKLRAISKKLTQITKAEKEKKNKDIEEELEEAIQKGDAAQIWHLSKKEAAET